MRKRGRLLLVLVLVAAATLFISLWVNDGPLWRMVMLKRVLLEGTWNWQTPLWFGEGPNWRQLILKEIEFRHLASPPRVRGWCTVKRRWGMFERMHHGRVVAYFAENGRRAFDLEMRENLIKSGTFWNLDGTVWYQQYTSANGHKTKKSPIEVRNSPPWLWGVTDQTHPTAPWWGKE